MDKSTRARRNARRRWVPQVDRQRKVARDRLNAHALCDSYATLCDDCYRTVRADFEHDWYGAYQKSELRANIRAGY